ncbi:hypothetical protein NPIL_274921 [Nephila pilipes]|uniref:Uncharacterized protein n=1 Tax=Nephila pilipes TaxID=299642 RepID=A0A8X6PX45_NEPPI|nr:hypothetical protein NPIL_274921 [Nephila pilipes]
MILSRLCKGVTISSRAKEQIDTCLVKVLELSWNPTDDQFNLDVNSVPEMVALPMNTNRFLLKAAGKIFDPLGMITPFTIRVKCIFPRIVEKKNSL